MTFQNAQRTICASFPRMGSNEHLAAYHAERNVAVRAVVKREMKC